MDISTTTTAPPVATTTSAPAGTTTTAAAAGTTTTAAPAGTTTTAAAAGTTTTAAPASTTTAGVAQTTTASGSTPSIDDVTVAIDPDVGGPTHPHSIQVSSDSSIQLTWSTSNATGIRIDGLGDFAASGSTSIPTSDASYSIVALGDGGAESDPWPLEVHTHAPGEAVSQHAEVHSGVTTTTTAPGTTTTAPAATTTAPGTTTTAPGTTTTAPAATTTAPGTTTTAPAATTTAPGTTTTSHGRGPLRVRLFDPFGQPLAGVACKIFVGGKELFAGNSGADGFVQTGDLDLPDTCQVKWTTDTSMPASDDLFIYSLDAFVNLAGKSDEDAARMRLSNLGYRFGDTLSDDIKAFQRDRGLAETGSVADVKDKLAEVHDNFEPSTRESPAPFFMSSNHEP